MNQNIRVVLGVAPFAAVIGFLTPMLVDRWSAGDPDRAGRAYAVNVIGCIVGPLLSGFLLLPWLGEQKSMLLLVLPWFVMAILGVSRYSGGHGKWRRRRASCSQRWLCFSSPGTTKASFGTLWCCATARLPSSPPELVLEQAAAGQRHRNDQPHAHHEDDDALHVGLSSRAATQRADYLLRNGHIV